MHSFTQMPIAVIGMACRLPGADDVDAFWRLVSQGQSMVQPLPGSRFERELYYDPRPGVRGRSYCDKGCLVNYEALGPQFDQLPEAVRRCPDVSYRMLCVVAAEALSDAGSARARAGVGGVYIGHTRNSGLSGDIVYSSYVGETARLLEGLHEFRQLPDSRQIARDLIAEVRRDYPHRDGDGGPELGAGVAAALVARTCGFDGPCMSFNSACASSLQALAYAVRGLQSGHIDVALVGGASYLHHDTLVLFSQARSLSAEQSRPFDAAADGLIVGEGYAALVLKTLPQAARDGDTIHAVIRGVGVASDGKGKSLWAPRQAGQVAAIRRAYELENKSENKHPRKNAPPALQYIEAHATSTHLGDATEVAALVEALGVSRDRSIALGSVKANIGHTLETAGLSGLLKTILCLRHRQIPPAIHVRNLNDAIDWRSIPFHVPTGPEPWLAPAGDVRRAGVSAFGIGGLNVHVVVEEFDAHFVARRDAPRPRSEQATSRRDSICIVGRGVVLPGALGLAGLQQLLGAGLDPKTEIPDARWQAAEAACGGRPAAGDWRPLNKLAGQVTQFTYDWRKHKIPPKQVAQASSLQFMILDAVEQAFAESGMDPASLDRARIGVVVGTHFGGEFGDQLLMGLRLPEFQRRLTRRLRDGGCAEETCTAISEQFAAALLAKWPALLDETGSFTSSSLASRITKAFDVMGGGVAVDAAGCSSAAALTCCEDALLAHDCDLMICVGGYEDLSVCRFERLALSGRLAQRAPKSPFDADYDGVVPGEGCAAVLLMRTSDARRQNRSIQAVIRAIGAATSPDRSSAARQSVERALAWGDTGPAPDAQSLNDVAAMETTSTGTPRQTAEEIGGIAAGYAGRTAPRPLLLGCLTAQIGYLEAASGLAALVKSTLELQDQQTAATFGLHTVNDAVRQTQFTVARQPAPLNGHHRQVRLAAAVHNGDDRGAYHILLERGAPVDVRSNQGQSAATDTEAALEFLDSIPYFDATRRRKNRMLAKSRAQSGNHELEVDHGRQAAPHARQSVPATGDTPSTRRAENSSGDGQSQGDVQPPHELEQRLIDVLVELTGHPRAAIGRDADLEADLGIDWLQKENLLRDLQQRWCANARELDLSDVLTVGDLLAQLGSTSPTTSAAPQSRAAPVGADASVDSVNQAARSEPVRRSVQWSTPQLREFLITFVVEQTGYPPEFVELDADLEADLGIDSIKKAMLFGELGEQLKYQPAEQLSLDAFPTLRHVLDYLVRELGLSDDEMPPSGPSVQAESSQAETSPEPAGDVAPAPQTPTATESDERQQRLVKLMPNYKQLAHKMSLLSSAGLSMPYFCEHERTTQDTTRISGREVTTFSSSNYLGMSGDPVVVEAAKRAIDEYGTSVSASRLIAGKPIHRKLEESLAKFLRVEKTLVFSSGYAANETTIAHLFGARDLILHDSLAHNCIIQGAMLSGARRLSFPHNNLEALDRLLKENCPKHRRTLIAIEGAYSMDGDYPDLPRVLELKRRYGAFLLVDDAHAIGTMGPSGRGIAEHFGLAPQEIDLWMGTLSKALGSCGGFLAGSGELIDYLKYNAPGFIYTVALSPASAAAALAALRLLEQQPERVHRLQHNTRYLLKLARSHGLDTGYAGHTPVVPILFGNSHTALLHSRRLLANGIDIQPIVYPAVENEAARLRFMITAKHTEEQIRAAILTIVANLEAVAAESVPSENWKSLVSGQSAAPVAPPPPAQPAAAQPAAAQPAAAQPAAAAPSAVAAQQPRAEVRPAAVRPEPAPTKTVTPSGPFPPEPKATPSTSAPASGDRRPPATSWSDTQLREFLVAFVVEHTGYPPDVVEMDADLEADLGIDSIKKAQLFGELAEQFDLAASADGQLSLDDFPTLQHIQEYVAQHIGVGS